jgi:hypothetical protein
VIIFSVGMQKSGSGWYFNLTNDLLIAAGYQDVRDICKKYRLSSILRQYNCNIGKPNFVKLGLISIPHLLGNTFVVKTHSNPTMTLRFLLSRGIMKATYIYRDPRDVAISAFEHGQKIRNMGENHSFAKLQTMESAILYTSNLLITWDKWMECRHVLKVRYEDVLADPVSELKRLSEFLSLDVSTIDIPAIVAKYHNDQLDCTLAGALHFNKGIAGRFNDVMSDRERSLCNKHFGSFLGRMGYSD